MLRPKFSVVRDCGEIKLGFRLVRRNRTNKVWSQVAFRSNHRSDFGIRKLTVEISVFD